MFLNLYDISYQKNNIFLSRSSQFTNEIDQQLNLLLS